MHYSKTDRERLYVNTENEGRGLIQQEVTYKTATIGLKKYLDTATDWMLQ